MLDKHLKKPILEIRASTLNLMKMDYLDLKIEQPKNLELFKAFQQKYWYFGF